MSDNVLYESQRIVRNCNTDKIKIQRNDDVYKLEQIKDIKDKLQEHLIVITLNNKNYINSIELVGVGSSQCITVSPKDVLRCALIRGSDNLIVAHNHPSGDNTPSKIDIEFTNKLNSMAKVFGINMLDHIVVGDECLSMRAQKYIQEEYDPILSENETINELKNKNIELQRKIDDMQKKSSLHNREIDELEM